MNRSAFLQHVHFPGLNSLRFYAALAVVVEHVRIQFSGDSTLFKIVSLLFVNAQNAVNLFFVLSGFLITYLFLQERATTGAICIRNFYIKRALRILPLYYWIALLGLIIFPILFGPGYPLYGLPVPRLILVFALLPNFASITVPMVHIWSIGVEEQFYVLWPWANRSDKIMLQASIGIILLKLLLTPVIVSFHNENTEILFYGLRFESMAIGALGAYVYAKNLPSLTWIYHAWIQALSIAGFAYLMVFDTRLNTYNTMWSSLIHIILIMNVATNPHSFLKLNSPLFEKLGEISYGLYMYHFPMLYLIHIVAYQTGLERMWGSPFLLLISTVASTCIIASLSYRWFETPFLQLKRKFTVLPSKIKNADTVQALEN
jgi:peptidoglycan/LPS O-acetylase OafA/YrhL